MDLVTWMYIARTPNPGSECGYEVFPVWVVETSQCLGWLQITYGVTVPEQLVPSAYITKCQTMTKSSMASTPAHWDMWRGRWGWQRAHLEKVLPMPLSNPVLSIVVPVMNLVFLESKLRTVMQRQGASGEANALRNSTWLVNSAKSRDTVTKWGKQTLTFLLSLAFAPPFCLDTLGWWKSTE